MHNYPEDFERGRALFRDDKQMPLAHEARLDVLAGYVAEFCNATGYGTVGDDMKVVTSLEVAVEELRLDKATGRNVVERAATLIGQEHGMSKAIAKRLRRAD